MNATNTTQNTTAVTKPTVPEGPPPRKTIAERTREIEAAIKPYTFTVRKYRQREAYKKWCVPWHVNAVDIEFFKGPDHHKTELWLRDLYEFEPQELYAFAAAFVECAKTFGLKKIFKIADPVPTVNELYEDLKRILDQPRTETKTNYPNPKPFIPEPFPLMCAPYEKRPEIEWTPRQKWTLDDFSFNNMDEGSHAPQPVQRPKYHGRVAFAPRGMAPRGGM